MRFLLLILLCCIISPPVAASASDTAASLPVTPTAAPATDEAAADDTFPDSGDAALTELPDDNSDNDAASQDTPVTAVIDLTEITLRLDSIIGMLAKLWQRVRFCVVAAFSWWFAKKSFRGVS